MLLSHTDVSSSSETDFIHLFLERWEGRAKERERNINQLPVPQFQLATWPATQAYALTGN